MQMISDELRKIIARRLKLGEFEKPVCRVEVDRLAFVPGDVAMFTFMNPTEASLTVSKVTLQSGGVTQINSAGMAFPAIGYSTNDISSPFGPRGTGFHSGVDIACPVGTGIVAAWDGTVSVVNTTDLYTSYGKWVEINHGSGVVTRYAHLSSVAVHPGQAVRAGDAVGLSGNTGNVRQNNAPVGGSYDDPNSPRSRGLGAHLHFEVREGGSAVNPAPYLRGTQRLAQTSTATGNVQDSGQVTLRPGDYDLYNQYFTNVNWDRHSNYSCAENFHNIVAVDYSNYENARHGQGALVVNFNDTSTTETWFEVGIGNHSVPGLLYVNFASDFASDGNSEFSVYANGNRVVCQKQFDGLNRFQSVMNVYIPAGDVKLKFVVKCGGGQPKKFVINAIRVRAGIEVFNEQQTKNLKDLSDIVFGDYQQWGSQTISIGRFVYMDTMEVPNVMTVEIDEQFEQEAAEAKITLSNPDGMFSPDYNISLFNEVGKVSPWSYFINGAHIGVLSENTPIRVYLGYGKNLIRVFTGLIDKTDLNNTDMSITITARNMYKRLMEKVITEDKGYPLNIGSEAIADLAPGDANYASLDRTNQIVYKAQQHATAYGVDWKLIVAIAKQETGLGTTGQGKEEAGSFVCGYGINAANKWQYSGIDMQCKMVAKRIKDALGNRPITLDNIKYLNRGGDLGPGYPYCTSDPLWADKVWNFYNGLTGLPQLFTQTASGMDYTAVYVANAVANGPTPYLVSAVVQDLVSYAGLTNWRAASDDMLYPDTIIEESYIIDVNQATGTVYKAVPGRDYEFKEVPIESIPTFDGWMNPFIVSGKEYKAYTIKVNEAIQDVLQNTNYWSRCDRYGTYRLSRLNFNTNVVGMISEYDNMVSLAKSIDFSRGRSHIRAVGGNNLEAHFIDPEILAELKGEVRTLVVNVPWATTVKQMQEVAKRLFWDMKRLCRTIQVAIPGRPDIDLLDKLLISDHYTTTREPFVIKGIRTSFGTDTGYFQVLDMFWCATVDPISRR